MIEAESFLAAFNPDQEIGVLDVYTWFDEMEALYGNRSDLPLDMEAVLNAYKARYGKEQADWERRYLSTMNDINALGRLDILWRAMRSAEIGDTILNPLHSA